MNGAVAANGFNAINARSNQGQSPFSGDACASTEQGANTNNNGMMSFAQFCAQGVTPPSAPEVNSLGNGFGNVVEANKIAEPLISTDYQQIDDDYVDEDDDDEVAFVPTESLHRPKFNAFNAESAPTFSNNVVNNYNIDIGQGYGFKGHNPMATYKGSKTKKSSTEGES